MTDDRDELKPTPFWWEDSPVAEEPALTLPEQVDALVVGGGFTGLNVARVLSAAGRSVLVCEKSFFGAGASTRNAGMLGPSFHKLGVQGLQAHYGTERAHAIFRESVSFVTFIEDLIQREGIDCDFQRCGRFRCAARPAHYEQMANELGPLIAATGIQADLVPKEDQASEIGSARFHGGVRYHDDAALHPGKYHAGLMRSVRRRKGQLAADTEVSAIVPRKGGFTVTTNRGTVRAAQLAICTNAHTGKVTPWLRRRLLPIRSAMIATDELPPSLMDTLMPTRRCYGDSRRVMAYYRPSPDGRRILFGGRATSAENAEGNAKLLRRALIEVFPQLKATALTHSWSGLVAYAFDHVPHLGQHDGLYYALGYCGSGVARSSYFGSRLAYKMLGDEEAGRTAFDDLPFTTRPFYNGNPWFMPAIIRWHRLADKLESMRA